MRVTRRSFLTVVSAALALPRAAWAAKLSLDQISAWLNGVKTLKATFTQLNSDGTISTGTLYMHRPGRMRFEYNPPNDALVLAGGGQVAIFDAKSNLAPEQYPLKKTPLSIILEQRVNLAQRNMVVAHREDGPATVVVAQDPEHPEYGSIALKFTANPVELRQWVITDDAGSQTTVILGQLQTGMDMPPSLFSITNEGLRRQR